MLEGLKLCAASIADQDSVRVQHIIQDNCTPGIDFVADELRGLATRQPDYRPEVHIEIDNGIYQAVNRGFDQAQHEFLAYLNCDEQYLPGALDQVARFFQRHPKVDVVFGDLVFIKPDGSPLYYQKTILPRSPIIRVSHLPAFTCATFFRRRVFDETPFREDLRAVADAFWILELLHKRTPMALLKRPTSTFTCSDKNFSATGQALEEKLWLRDTAPWWQRRFPHAVELAHKLEKAWHGCYTYRPFPYSIYLPGQSGRNCIAYGHRY